MKKILLLGASGSIGSQTLSIVNEHYDKFSVSALSVGFNVGGLGNMINKYNPKHVYVTSYQDYKNFVVTYPSIKWYYGDNGLKQLVQEADYDILVNALVGFVGVVSNITAIKRKKDIALANKESLVVAGTLINSLKKKYGVNINPIDSEHSAIWQCLKGNQLSDVSKIIITASGGSLRDLTRTQLNNVTVKQALAHPNWSMGSKITIDSATMMNKTFEIIEAHHLFGFTSQQIEVVIHKQSIVHGLVEFIDGSLIAALANPDMKIPILYALAYPRRLKIAEKQAFKLSDLSFIDLDVERFPLIKLAAMVIEDGDGFGCVINAANEVAVNAFLSSKIKFLDIEDLVFKASEAFTGIVADDMEKIIELDKEVRIYVNERIGD